MANDLDALNPEFWANEMQMVLFKENVAIPLANTELRDVLSSGDRVHKPYRSSIIDQAYTKGTQITTFNDVSATDEYLDVDTIRVAPFYIDEVDKIQNKWDALQKYAQDAGRVLSNRIDQAVLAQYSNARGYISSQDMGGSGTGSFALSASNVIDMFAVASRKLESADVMTNDKVAVIGPRTIEVLRKYVAGRESGFGDIVGENGVIGSRMGFQLVQSNNVPFTAVITISDTPTDGQTLTIDGVTFTWEAHGTSCNSAGEVDIGTSATDAGDNLCLAINGTTAATTSTYYDLSVADRRKLRKHNLYATNDAGVVTVVGYGDVSFAESSDNVAITSVTQYPMFMMRKAIDLVVQKAPTVVIKEVQDKLGKNVLPWTLYGTKLFDNMKDAITYASIDASNWV
ncbi:MAG: P22 phage major capsid protein family protein [Clostridia bacterium]|nr:P22 phage major capsid protein family protein [Clostridia bacterium]